MEDKEVDDKDTKKTKKTKKATNTTLIGQIFAALWIAGWSIYFNIKNCSTLLIKDIGMEGLLIVACFSPVFFNMFMDKIKNIRFGDQPEN